MSDLVPPTTQSVCGGCGHLRVCHRYGPCEHVKRIGWLAAHGRFTSEEPCTCQGWDDEPRAKQDAKKRPKLTPI